MLEILARASIDGAGLVCAIWIISRPLPRLPPAAKAMLWWCVAAKVVVALAWVTPIGVPVLPARDAVSHAAVAPGASSPATSSNGDVRDSRVEAGHSLEAAAGGWTWILMGLWAAGICGSAAVAVRSWLQARSVVRRSTSADPFLQACAREIADLLGLRRAPDVRLSTDVESPLITGVWRPLILVPDPRFMALSREQQRMALCHELAHVRRGDVWLGCVPAVAERIFFFHPLVRLAAREYAFWREAACDAAVLAALGTVPQAYGRLLLDLGVARPPVTLAAAGAAWSFSNLKRRIVMLNEPNRPSMTARIAGAAVLAVALVAIAPLKLVARPSAAADPALASVSFPVPAMVPAPSDVQPAEPRPREDRLSFVFFLNDDQTTMSGSTSDIARARRFRSGDGQLLWFRKDGREYVIRDADVLREVQAIWEPVNQLGEQQGMIGAKQGALGSQQGDLGAKQGTLGAEQGMLGARQGVLGARQGMLAARETGGLTRAERADIERERQAIEKEMRDLDQQMRALTDKMRDLDNPMRTLGDEMEVLGRQMAVLGGKMDEASRAANAAMRALFEKAIANGTAQAVQ